MHRVATQHPEHVVAHIAMQSRTSHNKIKNLPDHDNHHYWDTYKEKYIDPKSPQGLGEKDFYLIVDTYKRSCINRSLYISRSLYMH
jgi:hypothetical protein